jgi:hypothetical protein
MTNLKNEPNATAATKPEPITVIVTASGPNAPPLQPPQSKAEEIFRQGARFEYSTRIMDQHLSFTTRFRFDRGINAPSAPPTYVTTVVLDALTAEIYLKCLIVMETKKNLPPKGHDLLKLFSKLSKASRSRIKQMYELQSSPYEEAEKAFVANKIAQPNSFSFDQTLTVLSDAFHKWRYIYEGNIAGGTYFSYRISSALRAVILEMHPEWALFWDYICLTPTFPRL